MTTCDATLFPFPPRVPGWTIMGDPSSIQYFAAQQGPRPAPCVLAEHEGRWHWDGAGTWWEERANTWSPFISQALGRYEGILGA
jgi:hypothetical protein